MVKKILLSRPWKPKIFISAENHPNHMPFSWARLQLASHCQRHPCPAAPTFFCTWPDFFRICLEIHWSDPESFRDHHHQVPDHSFTELERFCCKQIWMFLLQNCFLFCSFSLLFLSPPLLSSQGAWLTTLCLPVSPWVSLCLSPGANTWLPMVPRGSRNFLLETAGFHFRSLNIVAVMWLSFHL